MATADRFTIPGPEGDLEATIDLPESGSPSAVAVCCHPHPQHGGAMTNKVIHTVARSLAANGIAALRFNFRGVGASAGDYDEGAGEQRDLATVVKWSKSQYPSLPLWLAGFSFGSWISALQAKRLQADQLISVAPPVDRFSFDDFQIPDCPWLVVQGKQDEIVDFERVAQWVDSLNPAPAFVVMDEASHFFHGQLVELREQIQQYIDGLDIEAPKVNE